MHLFELANKDSDGFHWMRPDRIDGVWWGMVFIWAALVLFAEKSGWGAASSWWNGWGVFWVGAGLLALSCAVVRLQIRAFRSKWLFSAIFGFIFMAIGLSSWQSAWWVWVVLLVMIGATILVSALGPKT